MINNKFYPCDVLAQLVERRPVKSLVVGSSPTYIANVEVWQRGRLRCLGKAEGYASSSVGSNPTTSSKLKWVLIIKAIIFGSNPKDVGSIPTGPAMSIKKVFI